MSRRDILPLPQHGQDARDPHGRDGRATNGFGDVIGMIPW